MKREKRKVEDFMKKPVFLCVFMFIAPLFIWAQGFYFDIGINLGGPTANYVYEQVYDGGEFPFKETGLNPLTGKLQLKAGYGPFGNIPVYVVAYGEIVFNGGVSGGGIGTGVLFYPWRLLQLGASIGINWMENSLPYKNAGFLPLTSKYREHEIDSPPGFAWDLSAALDFGKKNHGFLVGLSYFGTFNKFSYSYSGMDQYSGPYTGKGNGTKQTSFFGILLKYAYRKKPF
ncbi:MAG: hypothetical protein LBG95_08650 [Treponema sp.]|jgi:hypothetical protein|nr:hypothetical protein [Treponema sp.]